MEEHGPYCNCEDCWWARGQESVCSTCGCLESSCPCGGQTPEDVDVTCTDDQQGEL